MRSVNQVILAPSAALVLWCPVRMAVEAVPAWLPPTCAAAQALRPSADTKATIEIAITGN